MEQQEFLDALEDYTGISQMLKTHSYEKRSLPPLLPWGS